MTISTKTAITNQVSSSCTTTLKHCIDPTVDFVFKLLLGSPENLKLVIHFLNCLLKTDDKKWTKITDVTIENPFNERDFVDDKLSVVDVKVTDQNKHQYQIEIQLRSPQYLPKRMLFNWAQMYSKQIKKSEHFYQLKPLVSIWLLTENLFADEPLLNKDNWCHHFKLRDNNNRKILSEHCSIILLELNKWRLPNRVGKKLSDEHIWPFFFTQAHSWIDLPSIADTKEMRLAMAVLKQISDQELEYERYIARQQYVMSHKSDLYELELERQNAANEKTKRLAAEQQKVEAEKLRDAAEKLRDAAEQQAQQVGKQNEDLLRKIADLESRHK